MRLPAASLLGALLLAGFTACTSPTLPTAQSLTEQTRMLRQQAQPEFDELDRRRAAGMLSEEDYLASKAALERRVVEDARDAAWARHFLAESERKALGLPTPDQPVEITPPNAMLGGANGGGVAGGGSLYRPFTQQAMGGLGTNFSSGMVPSFSNINNSSTRYVQPNQ